MTMSQLERRSQKSAMYPAARQDIWRPFTESEESRGGRHTAERGGDRATKEKLQCGRSDFCCAGNATTAPFLLLDHLEAESKSKGAFGKAENPCKLYSETLRRQRTPTNVGGEFQQTGHFH